MDELIKQVEQWADQRGLIPGDPVKQFVKLIEEVGEAAREILHGNDQYLSMEIGDIMVVLIILCRQKNLDPETCLREAYWKIKQRQGETINGVFIKNQ